MILYRPRSIIELRKQTPDTSQILQTFDDCILRLYQGKMKVTEQFSTTKWAMIGSLSNDTVSGVIPACQRVPTPPETIPITSAHDLRIRDSALKTQNYGKGLDRFLRKFDPEVEMSATLAIYMGRYSGLIIIYLLGLAPAGRFAAPDNGA
jgi:hypothetical protein